MTSEIQDKICTALRMGAPEEAASRYAGIHPDTFIGWKARANSGEKRFVELIEACTRAKSECTIGDLGAITKAARGTRVTYPDTVIEHPERVVQHPERRIEHPDGRVEIVPAYEERILAHREVRPGRIEDKPGDWRAGAWRLSRRHPKEFGDKVQHTDANGTGAPTIRIELGGRPIDELRDLAGWDDEGDGTGGGGGDGAIVTPGDPLG